MKKRNLALGAGGAIGAIIALKLLTRARVVDWKDAADKIHHAEHSHFVEVDGATVHYQEFGEKTNPTLLLVHGYTASTYVWKTVAPKLADANFHVVAVDLLGFGYSDKPAAFDYTIAAQARMIERLMNRLGIGKATIIGSSYGGAVASTLALDYAERVEKLVLVGAVCNDEVLENPILKLAAIPIVGEILTPFMLDSKTLSKARMKQTLAPDSHHLITNERVESVIRPLKAKDAHHSVLASARNWDANRIQTDAHLINQPTLLIWGENDTVIPVHNGQCLYDAMLNSRLVVLKNCGHLPQEEKPEKFVELVSEFCRGRKGEIKKQTAEN
ncbi:MAG TPA: alpha/beta hydrolase [Pyrinomonadaceae bacterium]|nr:alpha/beta hydrolase [Pyrinomonadaceae bacterium]